MSRSFPCLAVAAVMSMVAVPTASYAQGPDNATLHLSSLDYSLETTSGNERSTQINAEGRIALYVTQDEPDPAPKKKKSNTALYVIGGVVVVVGLLALVAANTVVLPDDTFDGM